MADINPTGEAKAGTQKLLEYWAHGPGAIKIRWGQDGDFDRCVEELGKHVGPAMVKGLCSNLHQRATGARPGRAPGEGPAHRGKG